MNQYLILRLSLLALILLGVSSTALGQHVITRKVVTSDSGGTGHTTVMSANDVFFIGGIGALVMASNDNLRIDFMPDAANREKKYRELNIRQGDIIMMVNGKRTKTIEKIRTVFDKIEVGGEITLAIKRGKEMSLVSFEKSDNSISGGGNVMIMTQESSEGEDGHTGVVTRTITSGGPSGDKEIFPLMGFGVLLTDGDDQLKVMPKMKIEGMKSEPIDLEAGDIILSINDTPVNSTTSFAQVYETIPAGDKVTLQVRRGEETLVVIFSKSVMGEAKVIRRKKTD